jgi:hypothetical protein
MERRLKMLPITSVKNRKILEVEISAIDEILKRISYKELEQSLSTDEKN